MPNLGRVKLHDPKSRQHEYQARGVTRRYNIRHRLEAQHVDQFYLSGCVGFSATNLLNTRMAARSRKRFNTALKGVKTYKYLDNNDGIRNYSESTKRDPFPWTYKPDDEGSSALGVMKWLTEQGVISGYNWTFTFDAFLAALQKQPVLLGTNWYDDMMDTGANGVLHSTATGDGGGHEYLANAINYSKKLIGCEQSWGEHPQGFAPTFYIPFDLAEELIINQEGDVAVPTLL